MPLARFAKTNQGQLIRELCADVHKTIDELVVWRERQPAAYQFHYVALAKKLGMLKDDD